MYNVCTNSYIFVFDFKCNLKKLMYQITKFWEFWRYGNVSMNVFLKFIHTLSGIWIANKVTMACFLGYLFLLGGNICRYCKIITLDLCKHSKAKRWRENLLRIFWSKILQNVDDPSSKSILYLIITSMDKLLYAHQ